MNFKKLMLFSLCYLCLFGCAKPSSHSELDPISLLNARGRPPSSMSINAFVAKGKVSFSDGQQGGHASLEWRQTNNHYFILLMGPLGIGSLQIVGGPSSVSLTTAQGESLQAKTPEKLVKQALGWTMPISPLQHWLRGLPAPGTRPHQKQLDTKNRLQFLSQDGWTISYQAYTSMGGIAVPQKMLLQNGPLRLKFIFNEWHP